MQGIDEAFLDECGLSALSGSDRRSLLARIHEQLELSVGQQLSRGMSADQIEEFERIIDQDAVTVSGWVSAHRPDYAADALFQKVRAQLDPATPAERVLAEYAATAWLHANRPDYPEAVATVVSDLRAELRAHAPAILHRLTTTEPPSVNAPFR
ncbi:DUF5663 domain-containing protein [Microbacterium sp. HA-8]|uniref:DUF5663 domain-containing protein n=1 Tax=Microbacterium sp. HA-8 TaxID=3234200 RepID=UPI0038F70F1B